MATTLGKPHPSTKAPAAVKGALTWVRLLLSNVVGES